MLQFFDSQPKLQTITNNNQFSGFNSTPNQTKTSFINSPSISVFVKKFPENRKNRNNQKNKMQTEQYQVNQQNQLQKIKHYSRFLDSSSTLSKFNIIQGPPTLKQSKSSIQKLTAQEIPEQIESEKQMKSQQDQIVYNYYSSKNERKNKVLNKVKQLGKNNLYKFLKQSSIIQKNKHLHRLHSQSRDSHNLSNLNQIQQTEKHNQIHPMIFSYLSTKDEKPIDIDRKKFQLPNLDQVNELRTKIKLKTQSLADSVSLTLIKESTSMQISRQNKLKNKSMVRSLTQINQKIRRNRISKKDQLLFHNSKSNQPQNVSSYLQRWKYKSLFDSGPKALTEIVMSKKQKEVISKEEEKNTHHIKPPQFSCLLTEDQKSKSTLRKLKITRNNLLKKQLSKNKISNSLNFNDKTLIMPFTIKLG